MKKLIYKKIHQVREFMLLKRPDKMLIKTKNGYPFGEFVHEDTETGKLSKRRSVILDGIDLDEEIEYSQTHKYVVGDDDNINVTVLGSFIELETPIPHRGKILREILV